MLFGAGFGAEDGSVVVDPVITLFDLFVAVFRENRQSHALFGQFLLYGLHAFVAGNQLKIHIIRVGIRKIKL